MQDILLITRIECPNRWKGFSKRAMLREANVMKYECFEYITELRDYFESNLIITYYCGINITNKLAELSLIDSSFIAQDFNTIAHIALLAVAYAAIQKNRT